MELKKNKSAWAALATLGVGAVAAGATAFVKLRERRRQRRAEEASEDSKLSAEQMMVYNEAISAFLRLNNRIYELRRHRQELQPLIKWLATDSEQPKTESDEPDIQQLANDIKIFQASQLPFINACLNKICNDGSTYADYVRGDVGGVFDHTLDEEPTGDNVADGQAIQYVLRLGYYFPDSTLAPTPVKSVVIV